MSGPVFGDRVKLKVETSPTDDRSESHEPGETGLVVESPTRSTEEGAEATLRVLFEGDGNPQRLPVSAVTTDLDWVTPREASIVAALEGVLYEELVAKQKSRANRIATKLLRAYDTGVLRFEAQEASRIEREKRIAEEARKKPHSRACGITPHEHGPMCAKDCPTCYPARP